MKKTKLKKMMNKKINLKKGGRKKGFTIIELVVVLAIIGILAGALVPKFGSYITEAKKLKVLSQSREVVTAVETYNMKHSTPISDDDGVSSIMTSIDSYLDGDDLAKIQTATVADCREVVNGSDVELDEEGNFASVNKEAAES